MLFWFKIRLVQNNIMKFRNYNPETDLEASYRIWLEVGWSAKEDNEKKKIIDEFIRCGHSRVAEVNGQVESLVTSAPGTIHYLDTNLPFSCVTAVMTSHVTRKLGLAKKLTAQIIAEDAAEGAVISGLGMFEQGFYNQLGFGTGSYLHWVAFDPAELVIKNKARIPKRLSKDDWEILHASRLARMHRHGACSLTPSHITKAEMEEDDKTFGFGYYDGLNRELSHHIWMHAESYEQGPYNVWWMSYQTYDQFLELLAFLKGLGDQVHLIRIAEPSGIQFQDFMRKPFKRYNISNKSKYESHIKAFAWWQMRICDLHACLAQTHLPNGTVRFNLKLNDPIEHLLESDSKWKGIGGDYIVTLGAESQSICGTDATLPTLTASVGAFTRLWLGVCSASGLSVSDELMGSSDLLKKLDDVLVLPKPNPDWPF